MSETVDLDPDERVDAARDFLRLSCMTTEGLLTRKNAAARKEEQVAWSEAYKKHPQLAPQFAGLRGCLAAADAIRTSLQRRPDAYRAVHDMARQQSPSSLFTTIALGRLAFWATPDSLQAEFASMVQEAGGPDVVSRSIERDPTGVSLLMSGGIRLGPDPVWEAGQGDI